MNQTQDPYAPPPRFGAAQPAPAAGPAQPYAPYPAQPTWGGQQTPPPPPPPSAPRVPWWQRDGVVSRLLVFTGVGVTLIGVVMLLVIAAQNGLLRPEVRVTGGALLAGALIAAGWRVVDRPGGRVGGTALVGTGVAGLYLDTVAVTAFYEWLPVEAGLVLGAIIAALGMAVAVQVRSQALAVIVMLGAAVLAPVVTSGISPLLTAFLLVLMAAGAWPEIRYGWSALAPIRTAPVVLAAWVQTLLPVAQREQASMSDVVAAVLICAVALLATTASTIRRESVATLLTLPFAFLPAVLVAATLPRWSASVLCAALAVAVGLALLMLPEAAKAARATYVLLAAALATAALVVVAIDFSAALPVLVLGLFAAAVDRARPSNLASALAHLGLAIGGLVMISVNPPRMLISETAAAALVTSASVLDWAVLAIGAVIAADATARRKGVDDDTQGLWVATDVLVAGYAAMCLLVSAGVLGLGVADGFALAQFLITALLITVSAVSVHRGLTTAGSARRPLSLGLSAAAAALAKLFLFDTAALSGLARASAFLVVGLLLLAVGTRYARVFAERTGERQEQTHESTVG